MTSKDMALPHSANIGWKGGSSLPLSPVDPAHLLSFREAGPPFWVVIVNPGASMDSECGKTRIMAHLYFAIYVNFEI
jgi:hypothetical protein